MPVPIFLCRARGVTVRCIALALSAASVGCASSSNREDHRVENAAPDHHYRASDSQLNAASDRYTGGDLDRYEHSDDIWTKSQDRVLNARSPDQPHQHDAILSRPDQALQATNFSPLTDGPETPKRAPDSKEMLAITIAASESVGDPNALQILSAGVDDTQAPVRVVCARLRDKIGSTTPTTGSTCSLACSLSNRKSYECRSSIVEPARPSLASSWATSDFRREPIRNHRIMRTRTFLERCALSSPNLCDQVGRETLRTSHWGEGLRAFSIRLFARISVRFPTHARLLLLPGAR
jgi:hypothetical protein